MDLAARINAEIDFEELLSATWAKQLGQLHAHRDSGAVQADADSQETNGKRNEGDAR
jgi:hypothetical protein